MSEGIVELFEMIEVQHHDTQGLIGTQRAPDLALQNFFQVTAIEKAGQRIHNGLVAKRLSQPDIGDGEADLPGKSVLQGKIGFVELGEFIGGLKVQDSERLTLRNNGNANVAVLHIFGVGTAGAVVASRNNMAMSSAQGPAGSAFESGERNLAVAP